MCSFFMYSVFMYFFFFFFQAEDGIRDLTVTGVQTCALPISPFGEREPARRDAAIERREVGGSHVEGGAMRLLIAHQGRSEEHTSELQSQSNLVCRLLLEKKKRLFTGAEFRHGHGLSS